MKKIVHKSAVPLYAAAAVWVLYALLFPLHRVIHFAIVAVASVVVYLIANALCADIVEEVPEAPPQPETTGNEELDKMIADGKLAIAEMQRLNESIKDASISAKIDRLEEISGKIFAQVKAEPKKLPQIRKFMNYYLPTTLKLLNAYDRMSTQGVAGENISGTMKRVEDMMDTIVQAFEKQLDSLFGAEALDISTDITVLDNMMAREGLVDDVIHRTQSETASGSAAPAAETVSADEPAPAAEEPAVQEEVVDEVIDGLADDAVELPGGIRLEL
ncbi:MAG: 5-bromo-4-chloroindolyl phosphate hydrolysis family protein [Oscillospiraceae bacterium]|nr:5-bromo-4-chloroindolyl phosphate hydrolysis family protein [Oscillospiraceae bacterium]